MYIMDCYCIFSIGVLYLILIHHANQYENLSLNKTVTVSQRYNNKDFDPSLAVDGADSTDLLKCSLTASGQKEAWLTVDLGEEKSIAAISFVHGGLGINAKPMESSVSGIYNDGTSSNTVYWFSGGYLCYDEFTQDEGQVVCLNWGFLPDGVQVSPRSPGTPSFLFANQNYECNGNEAVLRDCSQNSRQCPSGQRSYLTCKEGDTLAGISVYVSETPDWRSGTLCYQYNIVQQLNNTVNIDCLTSGRYVTLFNLRNQTYFPDLSAFAYINICEIHIAGCDIGFYGKNCTRCPDNCLDEQCQFQFGHCFECKDGFKGDTCEEEYHQGRYGRACSFQCGNCLNQLSCDNINGNCQDGCSSGWTGDRCYQKCPFTVYGPNCNTSCSEHCQHRLCNHTKGHCLACVENRFGNLCENGLPPKAAFDTVSVLTATTTISLVVIIVLISYILRKKCPYSRQAPTQNYDVPEVITISSKYETLQRKKPSDELENNPATEYMEITSFPPEYTNLNRQ